MTPNQASDIFLYGKIIPIFKEPLTDQQMETYQLVKPRLSGGMLVAHAATEVARLLGEDRSATQSRIKTIQLKGWL